MKSKINKILILLTVLTLFFTSCATASSNAGFKKYSYEFFGTFDTVVNITGYTKSKSEFDKYSAYAYDRFTELHKLYDNYKSYEGINNIKTINDNAGISPVEVPDELINLLSFCITANKNISQKTDISMGALLNMWHNYREAGLDNPENAKVPSMEELTGANSFTGIDKVTVDEQKSTVYLESGTMLDLGAVAKGYATEIVADELIEMGFESFFISSGGNLKAVGSQKEDGKDAWVIGLQNPFYFDDPEHSESYSDIAYVNDMSVVTSGDYQRFYTAGGVKYHHLIDPVTLFPAKYFSSVTIFTKDSGLADFLSTALFMMPYEDGVSFIKSMEGVDAFWVFTDGRIKYTEGAAAFLKSSMR